MSELLNLLVDLDERFDRGARANALAAMERGGYEFDERPGADDTVLAWIDDVFGGSWSSEADCGTTLVARKAERPAGFASYAPQEPGFHWLRGVGREPGVGIFGPFGVDPRDRGTPLGGALLVAALAGLRARGYRRALIPAVGEGGLARYYAERVGATIAERFDPVRAMRPVRAIVMASGNGSNFQAVLDRIREGRLPIEVAALITNNPNAYAIERALTAEIPSVHVLEWKRAIEARAAFDARLFDAVLGEKPELVLLLGWMHLLDASFIEAFPNAINVHPSYLPLHCASDDVGVPDGTRIPAFRGPRAVRDALAARSPWTGVSVHRVTAQTDRGQILVRKPLRIAPGESESSLFERIHRVEHDLVPRGILRWIYEA